MTRPTLTPEQCQPISADNTEICCIASNRQLLLSAAELAQCPPLTTTSIRAVLEALDDTVGTPGTNVVTLPIDGTDQPGEEPGEELGVPGDDTAKANSGAGNAGETGS